MKETLKNAVDIWPALVTAVVIIAAILAIPFIMEPIHKPLVQREYLPNCNYEVNEGLQDNIWALLMKNEKDIDEADIAMFIAWEQARYAIINDFQELWEAGECKEAVIDATKNYLLAKKIWNKLYEKEFKGKGAPVPDDDKVVAKIEKLSEKYNCEVKLTIDLSEHPFFNSPLNFCLSGYYGAYLSHKFMR